MCNVDLLKANDTMNGHKLIGTGLTDNIVDIKSYMGKNAFVRNVFIGIISFDWQVGNGAQQGLVL